MRIRVVGQRTAGNVLDAVTFDTNTREYVTMGTYSIGNDGHADLVIHAKNNKGVKEVIEDLKRNGFRFRQY